MALLPSVWDETLQKWIDTTGATGIARINGRGTRRPSANLTVGGRAVVVGEDVTNQYTKVVEKI